MRRSHRKHAKELERRRLFRHRARLAKEYRYASANIQLSANDRKSKITVRKSEKSPIKFIMPHNVCVYRTTDSKELLEAIDLIEKMANEDPNKTIIFDFQHTDSISVSGAIVIKACIEKMKDKYPDRNIRIKASTCKKKVREIIQHIELDNYGLTIDYKDISRWIVEVYTNVKDENLVRNLDSSIQRLTRWDSQDNKMTNLLDAIPEALWNSSEHGYQLNEPFEKRIYKESFTKAYLIFGETKEGYCFCIFDRGIGFTKSFEYYYKTIYEKMIGLIAMDRKQKIKTESNIITDAIECDKKSRSKGINRGAGLPMILDNIVNNLEGRVFIHSSSGYYDNKRPKDEECDRGIMQGTLVEFSIPR